MAEGENEMPAKLFPRFQRRAYLLVSLLSWFLPSHHHPFATVVERAFGLASFITYSTNVLISVYSMRCQTAERFVLVLATAFLAAGNAETVEEEQGEKQCKLQ